MRDAGFLVYVVVMTLCLLGYIYYRLWVSLVEHGQFKRLFSNKSNWTRVPLKSIKVCSGYDKSRNYQKLSESLQASVKYNNGNYVRYSYVLYGKVYTSNSISPMPDLAELGRLQMVMKRKKRFCYVLDGVEETVFLVLPTDADFARYKRWVFRDHAASLVFSVVLFGVLVLYLLY